MILINIKTPQKLPTNKVWTKSDRIPPSSKLHTASTKFPTAHLLSVTTPLQFYSQLWQSIRSLMNVSVSTDGLHSPVCVFYVDSSPPWPAESAVSGPPDPPYILYNSPTLSVVTDAPPPLLLYFTKGYQPLVLSPYPLSILHSQTSLTVNKTSQREEKEMCFISVQIWKDLMSVYPDMFFIRLQ